MKIIVLFFFVLGSCGLSAQHVVSTSGATFLNSHGSISFTIGEGVAQTLTRGDKTLTQGFHQTTIFVASIQEFKGLDFAISAFPNPTTDMVILKVVKGNISGLHCQLFDISGKLIFQKNLESHESTVSVQYLPVGSYVLQVLAGKQELKTFKIIKL